VNKRGDTPHVSAGTPPLPDRNLAANEVEVPVRRSCRANIRIVAEAACVRRCLRPRSRFFVSSSTQRAFESGTYADSSIESDIATSEPVFTLSGASNLIRTSTATLPPDTLFTDPLIAPLADNGGATFTHALLPGSPAVDAGSNVADLEFDQRGTGYPRQMGHATDIGAFEVYADPIFADGFEQREGRSGSF